MLLKFIIGNFFHAGGVSTADRFAIATIYEGFTTFLRK